MGRSIIRSSLIDHATDSMSFPNKQLPLDFSIQDEFTFQSFVAAGEARELVHVLRSMAEVEERFYFIWGEKNTGKTHLLQAVCHDNDSSVYVPLKRFRNESPELLSGMEDLAVVCLDDLDAVAGLPDWEEKIFSLFNMILERKNKLVLAAGTSPRGLGVGLPDLASRLNLTVVYRLQELDDAGKAEALKRRALGRGIALREETLSYILQRSARGMESLFAVLDRLDEHSLTEKRRVTIPFIRDIMGW